MSTLTWNPQGGFSVTERNYAKIYGNTRKLSFMAREKAYGLSKKAPSRIKKKIGRQALRKKKHVSSQQSVVRCKLQVAGRKLQVACCPGQVIGSSSHLRLFKALYWLLLTDY